MTELLLELYSEEIPPQLQIAARSQIKQLLKTHLKKTYKVIKNYQFILHQQDLTLFIKDLAEKIKNRRYGN